MWFESIGTEWLYPPVTEAELPQNSKAAFVKPNDYLVRLTKQGAHQLQNRVCLLGKRKKEAWEWEEHNITLFLSKKKKDSRSNCEILGIRMCIYQVSAFFFFHVYIKIFILFIIIIISFKYILHWLIIYIV
uniref:Uncharacterized protein n=1 Tax=Rousettus aegyptiacus TaxID=9407 RepID=A0A7J8IN36_ROUAE|nr:hypothetical protein HJG63_010714 [Rousettus aegyptiacus]